MPIYRYRLQGPAVTDLSREVPGAVSTNASGYYYVDISALAGSKTDLDDAMASRGYTYVSQDPANTPADEEGTQSTDKISVYDEGSLLAKQPAINFIGGGVSAVNNSGASRIDVTIASGVTLTNTAPVAADAGAAAVGTGSEAARNDHKHQVSVGTPGDVGTANAAGSSNNLARADHVHNVPFSAVNTALGLASASIGVNSQKITSLLDPTNPQDAATKAYVDATKQGLDIKDSCRLATAVALPAYTASGSGATKILTANANAALTVDGVTTALNDRVLVKNQAGSHADHGLYTLTQVGTGSVPWILTRATDANASAEVTSGLFTFIEEGTQASSGWVLTTANPITLDTTALAFSQFSGAGQVVAGAGLTKTGNTLDVVANADGSIVVGADDVKVGVLANDTQHGTRGGGTLHANAIAAGAAGFMSGADKTKLDNLPTTPQSAVLLWGNTGLGTSTTSRYLTPGFGDAIAPTTVMQFRAPKAGTVRNLYVRHNTVGAAATNCTYTLRKNGTTQALTTSVAASANDGNDTSNSFTVVAGDLLDIVVTKAGSLTTSPSGIVATVELGP